MNSFLQKYSFIIALYLSLPLLMAADINSSTISSIGEKETLKLKTIFKWDKEDDAYLLNLPPLTANYFGVDRKLSNIDGISFIRIKKTGSKSTVQLVASGWLWGDNDESVVLIREPGGGDYMAQCNKSNCKDIDQSYETKVTTTRECIIEGHCTSGFETILNNRVQSFTPNAKVIHITNVRLPTARILSEFRHYCSQKFANCHRNIKPRNIKSSAKAQYICPTSSYYCDDKGVNWDMFVEYVSRQSNSLSRSLMTQMLGLSTVDKNIDLCEGAYISRQDSLEKIHFVYGNLKMYHSDDINTANISMETEVLKPVLTQAKVRLNQLDVILITDSLGTFGVSLAVAAAYLGISVPKSYDLLYEAKERLFHFPPMPNHIRAQVEPYMASDFDLWHYARSLVFQRASRLKSNSEGEKQKHIIQCMEYACKNTKPVTIQGHASMGQLSDRICEVNPVCDWAIGIPSVHRLQRR